MDEAVKIQLLEHLAGVDGPANMWEAGKALGMDRSVTEDVSTDLMAQGYLAIANLSGDVRVTEDGRSWLAQAGGAPATAPPGDLSGWLESVRSAGDLDLSGAALADFKLDIETLALQQKRNYILTPVITACLDSICQALESSSDSKAARLSEQGRTLNGSFG
jgi:hypothetical protein